MNWWLPAFPLAPLCGSPLRILIRISSGEPEEAGKPGESREPPVLKNTNFSRVQIIRLATQPPPIVSPEFGIIGIFGTLTHFLLLNTWYIWYFGTVTCFADPNSRPWPTCWAKVAILRGSETTFQKSCCFVETKRLLLNSLSQQNAPAERPGLPTCLGPPPFLFRLYPCLYPLA